MPPPVGESLLVGSSFAAVVEVLERIYLGVYE